MADVPQSEISAAVRRLLVDRNNWGRWGEADQMGTLNHISPEKKVQAAKEVRSGITISLSRPLPVLPSANNPRPTSHYLERGDLDRFDAGHAADFLATGIHGMSMTHLDALCHIWGPEGMWNGRNPDDEIRFGGAAWGAIDHWSAGIVTRGVLLDAAGYRQAEYVVPGRPLTGHEMVKIADAQKISVEPGDALVVYSGREKWEEEHGAWGGYLPEDLGKPRTGKEIRPGLDYSCLEPIRDWDIAALAWDMMDATPHREVPWTVHGAIYAYGLALIDNAKLDALVAHCRSENRWTFMLAVSPLPITGGTGSPVNPLALF